MSALIYSYVIAQSESPGQQKNKEKRCRESRARGGILFRTKKLPGPPEVLLPALSPDIHYENIICLS